jgi:hypothetical protein
MNSVTARKISKNPFYTPNEDQQYKIDSLEAQKSEIKTIKHDILPIHNSELPINPTEETQEVLGVEEKPKRRKRKEIINEN